MAHRKLVVVHDRCVLPELGGISGPIVTPSKIPVDTIAKMVLQMRTVYECDPKDPGNVEKRVRLTTDNVKKANFGETATATAKTVTIVAKEKTPDTHTSTRVLEATAAPTIPVQEPVVTEVNTETAPVSDEVKEEVSEETNTAATTEQKPVTDETATSNEVPAEKSGKQGGKKSNKKK